MKTKPWLTILKMLLRLSRHMRLPWAVVLVKSVSPIRIIRSSMLQRTMLLSSVYISCTLTKKSNHSDCWLSMHWQVHWCQLTFSNNFLIKQVKNANSSSEKTVSQRMKLTRAAMANLKMTRMKCKLIQKLIIKTTSSKMKRHNLNYMITLLRIILIQLLSLFYVSQVLIQISFFADSVMARF